jgi:hypothetical protein
MPNSEDWLLPINRFVLYEIVLSSCPNRKIESFDKSVADTVLSKILNSNGIAENEVNQLTLNQQILKRCKNNDK